MSVYFNQVVYAAEKGSVWSTFFGEAILCIIVTRCRDTSKEHSSPWIFIHRDRWQIGDGAKRKARQFSPHFGRRLQRDGSLTSNHQKNFRIIRSTGVLLAGTGIITYDLRRAQKMKDTICWLLCAALVCAMQKKSIEKKSRHGATKRKAVSK